MNISWTTNTETEASVKLSGSFDYHAAKWFKKELTELFTSHPNIETVEICLTNIHEIDAVGLGALLSLYNKKTPLGQARGEIALFFVMPETIYRLFERIGLALPENTSIVPSGD